MHLGDSCGTLCTAGSELSHALGLRGVPLPWPQGRRCTMGQAWDWAGIVKGAIKWGAAERGAAGIPGRQGGDRTHLTIMCLRSVLMPGAPRLPKSHSQLHKKADPTVIHFRWEALPSGMDENGSAAHTGHGDPGCQITGMGSHGIWIYQWGTEPGRAGLRLRVCTPGQPTPATAPREAAQQKQGFIPCIHHYSAKKGKKSFTGTRIG